jgi:hypothetical protein
MHKFAHIAIFAVALVCSTSALAESIYCKWSYKWVLHEPTIVHVDGAPKGNENIKKLNGIDVITGPFAYGLYHLDYVAGNGFKANGCALDIHFYLKPTIYVINPEHKLMKGRKTIHGEDLYQCVVKHEYMHHDIAKEFYKELETTMPRYLNFNTNIGHAIVNELTRRQKNYDTNSIRNKECRPMGKKVIDTRKK